MIRSNVMVLLVILLITSLAQADERLATSERAEQLIRLVEAHGIVEIAERSDLDERDVSLLSLMASLDLPGATDARTILERRREARSTASDFEIRGDWMGESWSTSTYNDFRALRAGANGDIDVSQYYVVFVENQSQVVFDEVVIFYQVQGDSIIHMTNVFNLQPASAHMFTLGYCHAFHSYAIGVYIGDALVAKQPLDNSQGLTPADVARMHPWDDNPCKDFWGIGR